MRATMTHATASNTRDCLARLLADERGATAIEYGLLAAVVAIMAIGGLQALSGGTGGLYDAMDAISLAIQKALAG
jgi:pilus assembly protein Flp/PilA